jgi:uncharacterized alkaline shock family protein YloU
MSTDKDMGSIDISPATIATITNQAVHQCYGVVGMANKSLVDGISNVLSRDNRKGIDVQVNDGDITIDVYVIVEYGVRIRTVAESIQNTVKFHIERALGTSVSAINVYVQGLRLNKDEN